MDDTLFSSTLRGMLIICSGIYRKSGNLDEMITASSSHFVSLRLLGGQIVTCAWNSTWISTSKLANQCLRKALFTCAVYTSFQYSSSQLILLLVNVSS